jgi:integrase
MTPHKTSPVLLPTASDLLPVESNVVRLRTAAKTTTAQVTPNLTKANVSKLVCPDGRKEAFFWDSEIKGLGLRVYSSGRKSWLVQYRDAGGRTRRHPVGQFPAVDPAAARKLAGGLLRRVAAGDNPSVERRQTRKASTVGDVFETYLAHAEKEQRPSSFDQTRRNLRKYAARLHRDAASELDRAAVSGLHQRLANDAGRVQANRVLASISAAWVWALRTGLVNGDNPAAYVPKFSEQARDRVLTPAEIKLIWQSTDSLSNYDRIVRILLLTACRRQEIGGALWSEIENDLLVVSGARMKGSRAHEVPLTSLTLAQLPQRGAGHCSVFSISGAGFDGWSAAKRNLDKRIAETAAPLPAWGLHDLRRTFSTMAHERGLADPHIVEAILAHEGARAGVAGVYNRAAYRDQKRAALNAWTEVISDIAQA